MAGASVRATLLGTGDDDTLNAFVRLWSPDKEKKRKRSLLAPKRLYAGKAPADFFFATTDAEGRFTLTGIGRDRCPQLTISAKGKATLICIVPLRPDFKPAPGGITGSPVFGPIFTLPIAPSRPVTGVVRDLARKPLAGIRPWPGRSGGVRPVGYHILPEVEVVTDAQGRYSLDGLPRAKNTSFWPTRGPARAWSTSSSPERCRRVRSITADFDLRRRRADRPDHRSQDRPTGSGHLFYRPWCRTNGSRSIPTTTARARSVVRRSLRLD